jgi:acyl-CoA:acyl-CoA alkyltransferase
MKYQNVCLESVGYSLPEEVVTSEQLEARLAPLYERLRLAPGRLELMTGIRERRFWPRGMLPSEKSVESGRRALEAAQIDRGHIGALIHASVCRDFLEPATACSVHHRLELPRECLVYDVSNACLGILNGMVQVANMIELGQIRAGLIVGTESARPLVETTIEQLNADPSLTRADLKRAIASLTIGSGSAAVLLVHKDFSQTQNQILGAIARSETEHHVLCHSGRDESIAGDMRPLMDTDSERLMEEGIRAGAAAFAEFQREIGWSSGDIDKTFCHQVTATHRKLMLASLGLDPRIDFPTVETLGNTGSVALPLALALGIEQGHLAQGDRVALFGIGSGINVLLMAMQWHAAVASPTVQASAVTESTPESRQAAIERIMKMKMTLGPDLTIRQLIEEGRR